MSWMTIALYGAGLSTINAAWSIYDKVNDRPRLKLQFRVGELYTQQGKATGHARAILTVVNAGRRVAYVRHVGGDEAGDTHWMQEPNEKKLGEGERCTFEVDLSVIPESRSIYVVDSTERKWKVAKKQLDEAKKAATRRLGTKSKT